MSISIYPLTPKYCTIYSSLEGRELKILQSSVEIMVSYKQQKGGKTLPIVILRLKSVSVVAESQSCISQ